MTDAPKTPPILELACGCVLEDNPGHFVIDRPCRVAKMIMDNIVAKKVSNDCLTRHVEANRK